MSTVNTPQGAVRLLPPPVELLHAIRSLLPFGAIRYGTPQKGAGYGIVMQCGDEEVYCVKQQPVPCDEEQGLVSYQAHSVLIAQSIAGYLHHGFSSLLMPCPYMRRLDTGQVESGIAYVGAPAPHSRERQAFPAEGGYDRPFGHGFTIMMTTFIRTLQQSSQDIGIFCSKRSVSTYARDPLLVRWASVSWWSGRTSFASRQSSPSKTRSGRFFAPQAFPRSSTCRAFPLASPNRSFPPQNQMRDRRL